MTDLIAVLNRGAGKILPILPFLPVIILVPAFVDMNRPPVDFVAVDARVTRSEEACMVKHVHLKGGWENSTKQGLYSCGEARDYAAFHDVTLTRYFVLNVEFVSPADGRPQTQRMEIEAARLPPTIAPGMTLKILASKTVPYSARYFP